MPSNLPDGCTQADIDNYYGWDCECPECGAELEVEGDKWEMGVECSNPECDYERYVDNLP